MSRTDFQNASEFTDCGRGPLGQVAAGLLTAAGTPRTPVLALVYNTLPDPPGAPGYATFAAFQRHWDAVGGDVRRYLHGLARALRSSPGMDTEEHGGEGSDEVPTRLDGLALAFHAATMRPEHRAGRALVRNVSEGYYLPGDVAASPASRRESMVMAVDRDAHTALLSVGADGAPTPQVDGPHQAQGPTIDALTDLLAAFWEQIQAWETSVAQRR